MRPFLVACLFLIVYRLGYLNGSAAARAEVGAAALAKGTACRSIE